MSCICSFLRIQTFEQVEKNRLKFAHIKDAELASRKKFVDDMQQMLQGFLIFLWSAKISKVVSKQKLKQKWNHLACERNWKMMKTKLGV